MLCVRGVVIFIPQSTLVSAKWYQTIAYTKWAISVDARIYIYTSYTIYITGHNTVNHTIG